MQVFLSLFSCVLIVIFNATLLDNWVIFDMLFCPIPCYNQYKMKPQKNGSLPQKGEFNYAKQALDAHAGR